MGVSLKRIKVSTTVLVARMPSMAREVGTRAQGELHSSLIIGVGRHAVLLWVGRMSEGHVSQVNSSSWCWYPSQSCRQVREGHMWKTIASSHGVDPHVHSITSENNVQLWTELSSSHPTCYKVGGTDIVLIVDSVYLTCKVLCLCDVNVVLNGAGLVLHVLSVQSLQSLTSQCQQQGTPFTIFFLSPGSQGKLQMDSGTDLSPPDHCISSIWARQKHVQTDWDREMGRRVAQLEIAG